MSETSKPLAAMSEPLVANRYRVVPYIHNTTRQYMVYDSLKNVYVGPMHVDEIHAQEQANELSAYHRITMG